MKVACVHLRWGGGGRVEWKIGGHEHTFLGQKTRKYKTEEGTPERTTGRNFDSVQKFLHHPCNHFQDITFGLTTAKLHY